MNTLIPKESYYGNYYYYNTPSQNCIGLTIIVFENTLSISEDQLNTLRLVLSYEQYIREHI